MTKLMQWLLAFALFGTLYLSVLSNIFPLKLTEENRFCFILSPVFIVILFGDDVETSLMTKKGEKIYSVFVVLYRVATFNDCAEAAAELKEEIAHAKKDLASKGLKFD